LGDGVLIGRFNSVAVVTKFEPMWEPCGKY